MSNAFTRGFADAARKAGETGKPASMTINPQEPLVDRIDASDGEVIETITIDEAACKLKEWNSAWDLEEARQLLRYGNTLRTDFVFYEPRR